VKVVVTGHHGYIGSVLVPVLARAGHEVLGIDSFYYEGCDLPADAEPATGPRLDVRDVEAEHLAGADAVVHLAALSNDPLGELRPELTREINFRATVGVARAAREAGVPRFVFASSCSMYGAADSLQAVDEQAPLRPLSEYARSKILSEEALTELAGDTFSPIFMRNATAYGVSPRHRVDLVVNNLVGWAHTTGVVRILSDGTPWRPLVHLEDIAQATLALLEAPTELVHCEAFNVGADSENYQVRDLAEIVEDVVPGCRIEYAGAGEPDPRSYRVDFGKLARTFPELQLSWNARRGVEELALAYQQAGLTQAEFEGDRYTRLRRLERLLADGSLDDDLRWATEQAAHALH
jgi:nucleoside-diphosphate-sugar epimerase